MVSIHGSVGVGGENRAEDVKIVQKLLNKFTEVPYRDLLITGFPDSDTLDTIIRFQKKYVKMTNPDGLVDPRGRTMRTLRKSPSDFILTREKFLDPRVKENAKTKKIIDDLLPHFVGVNAQVISGYLTSSDLYWKVNWHWYRLLNMINHALTLNMSKRHRKCLLAVKSVMKKHPPNPDTGYEKEKIGFPSDSSSLEEFNLRYKDVKQSKRDFKRIADAAELQEKSKHPEDSWHVAFMFVAPPEGEHGSNHITGYALDIKGDNKRIEKICKKLGATFTDNEGLHIHAEFRKGVQPQR